MNFRSPYQTSLQTDSSFASPRKEQVQRDCTNEIKELASSFNSSILTTKSSGCSPHHILDPSLLSPSAKQEVSLQLCLICSQGYTESPQGAPRSIPQCGHTFCDKCLRSSVEQQKKDYASRFQGCLFSSTKQITPMTVRLECKICNKDYKYQDKVENYYFVDPTSGNCLLNLDYFLSESIIDKFEINLAAVVSPSPANSSPTSLNNQTRCSSAFDQNLSGLSDSEACREWRYLTMARQPVPQELEQRVMEIQERNAVGRKQRIGYSIGNTTVARFSDLVDGRKDSCLDTSLQASFSSPKGHLKKLIGSGAEASTFQDGTVAPPLTLEDSLAGSPYQSAPQKMTQNADITFGLNNFETNQVRRTLFQSP